MTERVYDAIIVGAGVAGSRLLAHLLAGPWRGRRILLVDRSFNSGDHALAWWSERPDDLDPLIDRGWTAVRVIAPDGAVETHPLHHHRYVMTRRAALTAAAVAAGAAANVERLDGLVEEIVDGAEAAAIRVGERWFHGRYVFDSRRPAPGPATVRLVQRFTGWTVTADTTCFDPDVATLFDFRTAQRGAACFVYVLPAASGRALVEHVYIGREDLPEPTPEEVLPTYLEARLGLREGAYSVVASERGSSPLSDARHPRRVGRRICTIGLRGGRLKPSSGYALARIERDSAAIARSLTRWGHPFRIPREGRLYAWLDAIFLWVLAREPVHAPAIFLALMRRPDGTLRFLDERATLIDFVRLLIALPTRVFLRAARRWLFARRQRPARLSGPCNACTPSP